MRALRRLLTLAATAALIWLGRYPLAELAGRALIDDDAPSDVDAIVVLGGDAEHRAPQAADLYRGGVAPVVLAVGASNEATSQAKRSARVLRDRGVPRAAIQLAGEDARSTYEEAEAACAEAEAAGWTAMAVVSSPYHTRRAGIIFADACSEGIRIEMSPSIYDDFDPASWWRNDKQTWRLRNEYLKLGYHLIRPIWGDRSGEAGA